MGLFPSPSLPPPAGGGPAWKLQFPVKTQWVNPLIGWSSTADVMHTVANQMYFASKEEAVAFAERNGWRYEVEEPHARTHVRPKRYIGYGDNYSVKRKVMGTWRDGA